MASPFNEIQTHCVCLILGNRSAIADSRRRAGGAGVRVRRKHVPKFLNERLRSLHVITSFQLDFEKQLHHLEPNVFRKASPPFFLETSVTSSEGKQYYRRSNASRTCSSSVIPNLPSGVSGEPSISGEIE